jgi:hypothetical protein
MYRDGLSDDERAALDKDEASQSKDFTEDSSDIPEILKTFSQAPYNLGEAMLDLAIAIDGNDAVDALFRYPPRTEEHLLDPWTLFDDEDEALEVSKPRLRVGEEKFDSGALGTLTWYTLLAERLPLLDALDAVDGWGGDSYVAFERDAVSCVRINYVSDSPADRVQMQDALQTWVTALPGAPASVTRDGEVLTFESCDPGVAADVGSDSSGDALHLALVRTYLAVGLYESGQEDESRCLADSLAHEFSVEQLTGTSLGDDPEAQQEIARLVQACR